MSKESLKVFYCDAETTGLDPKIHEIVQLACIVEINNQVVEEFEIKMRPSPLKMKSISPEALKVQGRTVAELLKFPARAVGYKAFMEMLDRYTDKNRPNDKFTWVGQCPEFDRGFTREFMREFNNSMFDAYFDRRSADLVALSLAMKQKGLINPRNLKLETIAEVMNIAYNAHDALEDIRTTRQIWQEYLNWIEGPRRFGKQLSLI